MSVIPELAYIQKSSCELLFFAAPPTLSFFYKQLLYKQLGSDFLKAKQFSASDLRIFSNFAGFQTCYYIH